MEEKKRRLPDLASPQGLTPWTCLRPSGIPSPPPAHSSWWGTKTALRKRQAGRNDYSLRKPKQKLKGSSDKSQSHCLEIFTESRGTARITYFKYWLHRLPWACRGWDKPRGNSCAWPTYWADWKQEIPCCNGWSSSLHSWSMRRLWIGHERNPLGRFQEHLSELRMRKEDQEL